MESERLVRAGLRVRAPRLPHINEGNRMPYVEDEVLTDGESTLRGVLSPTMVPQTPGELNYYITMGMNCYLQHRAAQNGRLSYALIAEALSACHEAEQEFRRRVLAPYEDAAREKSGDVYLPEVLT